MKFDNLVQNDIESDVVEIETGSRIQTWRTFVFLQTGNSYISAVD